MAVDTEIEYKSTESTFKVTQVQVGPGPKPTHKYEWTAPTEGISIQQGDTIELTKAELGQALIRFGYWLDQLVAVYSVPAGVDTTSYIEYVADGDMVKLRIGSLNRQARFEQIGEIITVTQDATQGGPVVIAAFQRGIHEVGAWVARGFTIPKEVK